MPSKCRAHLYPERYEVHVRPKGVYSDFCDWKCVSTVETGYQNALKRFKQVKEDARYREGFAYKLIKVKTVVMSGVD